MLKNENFPNAIKISFFSFEEDRECHEKKISWKLWHAKGFHLGNGKVLRIDYRDVCDEKHNTTKTPCLYAPSTIGTHKNYFSL
jgi:hypothetical protein